MCRPDNTARNAEMARLYVGGSTLQAIGEKFGLTRERVRQIIRPLGVLFEHGGRHVRSAKRAADRSEQRTRRFLAKYDMTPERFATRRRHLRAYKQQERNAAVRGIEWRLTFGQWIDVWEESGKLEQRGRHADAFVMSRKDDAGAYEIGNVVIKTLAENSREAVAQWVGKKKAHKGVFCLMAGTARPYVAKVGRTRIGRFETAEEAAAARAQFIAQARTTPDATRAAA